MKYVMDIYFETLSTEHKYDKFLLQQYWDETNTLVKNALSSYVTSNYPSMVEEKTHENTCGYEYTKGKKSGQLCGHKVVGPNRKTCYRHTPQLQCIKNQITVKNTVVEVVHEDEVVKTPIEKVKTPNIQSDVESEVEEEESVNDEEKDEEKKSINVEEEEKKSTVESLFGEDEEEDEEEKPEEPKYCTFVPQKGKFKGTVCGHEVTGDKPHCTKHMKYPATHQLV